MIEWLRPGWLLALPLAAALLWAWWRAWAGAGLWRRLVDAELLAKLAARAPGRSAPLALAAAGAALALACLALAGPSWRTQPEPLYRDQSARIVVLDLSPSMDAIDLSPSRLERARAAIVSILRESGDAQLGLVVFGADAFTVAPLMNDASALVHLLASLGTATVPRAGSRPDLGLDMARALLARSGVVAGDVILVGDSAGDARALDSARALAQAGFPLSVLAVGTPQGGPVRLASGAFARTGDGDILVARPELAALERVARAGGGRFHTLAADTGAAHFARGAQAWAASPSAPLRKTDVRQDDGAWLLLLALPFAALLFRRGWLMAFAALAFGTTLAPAPAQAFDWNDLWQRADQQAAAEFAKGRLGPNDALLAKLGPDSPWRALLLYRSGRFDEAAARFAAAEGADAHYNRGNALALDGRLEAAIAAYGAALERRPSMRDALFNRALLREALERRRAQAPRAGESKAPASAAGASPRAPEDRDAKARPAPREASGGESAGQGEAPARADEAQSAGQGEGAAKPDDALSGAELRRLEGMLARVPDDPGELLANRFAWQLRLRGNWHGDKGAPW